MAHAGKLTKPTVQFTVLFYQQGYRNQKDYPVPFLRHLLKRKWEGMTKVLASAIWQKVSVENWPIDSTESALNYTRPLPTMQLSIAMIIADTKFELGLDYRGDLYLIDEILTPDSAARLYLYSKSHARLARKWVT